MKPQPQQIQFLRLLLERAERGELDLLAVVFSDGKQLGHCAAYAEDPLVYVKAIGKLEQLKLHIIREMEVKLGPLEPLGPRFALIPNGETNPC